MEEGVKRKRKVRRKLDNSLTPKERSKRHRERKREYYTNLEHRISKLEEEIRELKIENQYLKTITNTCCSSTDPISEIKSKLMADERYTYQDVIKKLETEPDSISYAMWEQFRETMGMYGTDRIKLLKSAFDLIVKYALPEEIKPVVNFFTNFTLEKTIKIFRGSLQKTSYKYFKEGKEDSLEDMLKEFTFSDPLLDKWSASGECFANVILGVRKCINDIVKIRNKLFTLLKVKSLFLIR